jgi:hypothetical protein
MFKDGSASDGVFWVKYSSVEWDSLDNAQIDAYVEKWERSAKTCKCVRLVVQVSPDSLFGTGDPYIAVQRDYDYAPWRVNVSIEIVLHPDTDYDRVRQAILQRLRIAYGPKTKYLVRYQRLVAAPGVFPGIVEEGVI